MKYALIKLPNNFEKGCCQDCPLSYTEWFDDDEYTDCKDVCVLNSRYDECPLDIRTERIPFDFELYEAGLMDMPKKMIKVLDKIRAEIKGKYRVVLKDTPKDDWAVRWNDCIDEVLQIIDKYRAESE